MPPFKILPSWFKPLKLSPLSSDTVPDSLWASQDIQLGAGVVIIQPETEKLVVLSEKYTELVKTGRKIRRKLEVSGPHSPQSPDSNADLQSRATPNGSPIQDMPVGSSSMSGIARGFGEPSLENWLGLRRSTSPELPHEILEDEYVEVTKERWFLPKGRKDVGESLEDAALREGYEESGYRCTLFPLPIPSNAPNPNLDLLLLSTEAPSNTEPIYVSTHYMAPNKRRHVGLEYLTFWYIAYVPLDAVREENTGMDNEVNYETHLLSYEEAMKKLSFEQRQVAHVAWSIWVQSVQQQLEREQNPEYEPSPELTSESDPE